MFDLARGYKTSQMTAYVALQQAEFAAESSGYTATRHQREVGAGYFDAVTQAITGNSSSLGALHGSTEEQQFRSA
jgi:isocitrate lyase